MTRLRPAHRCALALGINAVLVALVYHAYLDIPLRLHDHHLVLLLVQEPDLVHEGFFWRLLHHRLGGGAEMYFRFLSYLSIHGLAHLFGENALLHYLAHFAAHLGAGFVLYRLACALSRSPAVAALVWSLFTVFVGSSDTVGIPYYTHLFGATALAGLAGLHLLRYVAGGSGRSLAAAVALSTAATLLYDTFLLMTVALPFLAAAARRRSWHALFLPGRVAVIASGTVLALIAGITATQALVPEYLRPVEIDKSLAETLRITVRRAPFAAAVSAAKHVVDVFFFLPGRLAEMAPRGNMPYWSAPSMLGPTLAAMAATAIAALGMRLAGRGKASWSAAGWAAVAAGAWLDWRSLPLAGLAWCLRKEGLRRDGATLLLLLGIAILCAMNTAIGRASLYSLQAIRHHYVSGFLALAVLAALLRDTRRVGVAVAAMAFLVVSNGLASARFIRDYSAANDVVFGFDRALRRLGRAGEREAVFVPSSTSRIRSPDWQGQICQDWVFDILHASASPLTRHVTRARFLYEDGRLTANPLQGAPDGADFRIDLRLSTEESRLRFDAKESFRCLGREPDEPRLEITRAGFRLVVRRVEGASRAYDFTLPVETNRFFYEAKTVSLVREGKALFLTTGGAEVERHVIAEKDEFLPWRSDGTGLLGRDAEILLAKLALFDMYVRVGPGLPGRIP